MLAVLKPVGRLKKHVMNRSMQPKHTRATVKRKPAGQSPAGFLKRLQNSVHATRHDNHDACWYRTC